MKTTGELAYPKVVEYRYKLLGFIPCKRMTIVWMPDGKSLEELVTEKTGHKNVTIIDFL
ncbi:hypothetical protein EV202_12752 [Bacteroides heparinolyticus]|uniref:Uncharacterized protein n=1 Tax=Prevotella heparinolytica TaxID=28113 RepID=A0A4R2LL28_9BACE|nr:hypothetical protein [Bacteroides heparinolyticus]TCO88169.1 hypothetical protein EV202_12752 [Bacteroides heparinolyticus]